MKTIRAILRAILFLVYTVYHVIWVVVPAIFRGKDLAHALAVRQLLVIRLLHMLGVELETKGSPPPGAHIYVCNHRSYLDPILILRDVQLLPVAKAEMASWPIIGATAKATGIVFVKRESKLSRAATLDAMRDILSDGYPVLIYPEGTTHLRPTTIDFRTGAFTMAAKYGLSMVPCAMDFELLDDSWVGDELFVPNFMRVFGKKKTRMMIRYGEPVLSSDQKYLVETTKNWIDENMLAIRQEFDSQKTSTAVSAFGE